MRIEPGQFWRDTVNGDLLKILEVKQETFETGNPFELPRETKTCIFIRSACMVNGVYFGIQEMQAKHFEEERFQLITGERWRNKLTLVWYRWKHRNVGKR